MNLTAYLGSYSVKKTMLLGHFEINIETAKIYQRQKHSLYIFATTSSKILDVVKEYAKI